MANIIDCEIDKTTLNKSAEMNPSTLKPPTISEHSKIIMAFMKSKNSPKVKIVIGNVKITINGLIKIFNKLKTKATISAVTKSVT